MENSYNAGLEFIDELMLKYRISLRTIAAFANDHKSEIKGAEDIYALKSEQDKKLCLAVFRLMAGKYAASVSECFSVKYSIGYSSVDDLFFEKTKLFLITAFVYNSSFFTTSWNLCGIIRAELAFRASSEEKIPKTEHITIFTKKWNEAVNVYAASGNDEILKELWSKEIEEDNIRGKLRILANNKDDAGIVQFRFKFADYQSEPPFYLRIIYKTKKDAIECIAELDGIAVNSAKHRELIIASVPQKGISYSEGLIITEVRSIKK